MRELVRLSGGRVSKRQAARSCFAVAERLRTESASETDLQAAIELYRGVMRASRALRARARERLLLMLCQLPASAGAGEEVGGLLRAGGFMCRLSADVLCYPRDGTPTPRPALLTPLMLPAPAPPPPRGLVHAMEAALPRGMLRQLQRAFSPQSPFWAEHGYQCGASPFFSYVHKLGDGAPATGFDRVLKLLLERARAHFPRASLAKYAEWWAHCRPHGTGHQMHYDSDDEGRGALVRNPLVSSALFLTGGIGGPTLVTEQRPNSHGLARKGWAVLPEENRYLLFDGGLLHGVVPGRGCPSGSSSRRVSLMVAFWASIKERPSEAPAAARPFPYPQAPASGRGPGGTEGWTSLFDWSEALDGDGGGDGGAGSTASSAAATAPPAGANGPMWTVQPVWEMAPRAGGEGGAVSLLGLGGSMPEYERCFQGLSFC